MKQGTCEHCGRASPLNSMFSILGQSLCAVCAKGRVEALQAEKREIPKDAGFRMVDPTICAKCGKDNGAADLHVLAGMPICPACRDTISVPFPKWVKIASAVLGCLVVFSFTHNLRFLRGYFEMSHSEKALFRGDIEEAYVSMDSAARHVPEAGDLRTIASLYQAILLMKQNKDREALPLLQGCQGLSPKGGLVDWLILQAEGSIAFDEKDYDRFLEKAGVLLKLRPDDPTALAGMASAYACKYAATGRSDFEEKSLQYLEQASGKTDKDDEDFREYEARIRYRLKTREIISSEEYRRRVADGSIKEEAGK